MGDANYLIALQHYLLDFESLVGVVLVAVLVVVFVLMYITRNRGTSKQEIPMSRLEYEVSVSNGLTGEDEKRGFGYRVWWDNPAVEGKPMIESATSKMAAVIAANEVADGDLKATLSAWVDGVANPPQVFTTTWEVVTDMQKSGLALVRTLVDATAKHHKAKKLKKNRPTIKPTTPTPG